MLYKQKNESGNPLEVLEKTIQHWSSCCRAHIDKRSQAAVFAMKNTHVEIRKLRTLKNFREKRKYDNLPIFIPLNS